MQEFTDAFSIAFSLVATADADLMEIIWLSIRVSLTAVAISLLIGLPIGAALAIVRFPGRTPALIAVNALMGLPPVVVGLVVYMFLSKAGPFGWLSLLYTPTAMIIAQCILIAPIIAALSCQVIADLHEEYKEQFRSLCVPAHTATMTLLWDARFSLMTVVLAGFGRAIAEVGAVMIVGGNINHLTRVMTTAIALETSRGELGLALALGIILLGIALIVNGIVIATRMAAVRFAYA